MYERDALERITKLFETKSHVIVCGGTGLYIKALCEGLDDLPKADEIIRKQLIVRLEAEGLRSLQNELKRLDPVHFEKMDTQNPQRVIRALEVCISTGEPFSSYHTGSQQHRNFKIIKIGLELPRNELYDRINQRTDQMLESGWLDEAKAVFEKRHLNALNTVGYKELFSHLAGDISLDEATDKIKINTRRFAKRQMTWFKKDNAIKWFETPTISQITTS